MTTDAVKIKHKPEARGPIPGLRKLRDLDRSHPPGCGSRADRL